jgi:hypothetical protein
MANHKVSKSTYSECLVKRKTGSAIHSITSFKFFFFFFFLIFGAFCDSRN